MSTTRTHAHEGGLVVFVIGMIIRKPWRPDLWGPTFTAMPKMLAELRRNKAAAERGEADHLGFLGAETTFGPKGPLVIQYWRSVDHLYGYAHRPDLTHVPAWRAFNTTARAHPDAVGIWHETYVVPAGGVETVYGGGATVGLGAATGTIPAERRGRGARERLESAGRPAPSATP